ncbi:glutamyl-tRNA reductase [Ferrimonas balearica]|uniref:glutamyl-tRNA reductase n=1 Tax=Ferrimonas balearica TaxID=44012 RepID=UPI001C99F74B|nr:glutamyl-tRNA reductase [Ferrimonas balearica]MBY5921919.1 glutamyl-tRNA reductase [Ferrimonas balearica]MBY5994741.1 glutamyl-tRNA reductase [Ferrimonas balearica]
MTLVAIGINHKTASVSLREKVAFGPDILTDALKSLADQTRTGEAVILSTCNRTELYTNQVECERLIQWLSQFHNLNESELRECIYLHTGQSAVHHLLRVSAGLDSLVLGEPQILGQIKQAFADAKRVGTIAHTLDRLFQHTFKVAKRIRTETEIGSSAVSVAFAAVNLARHIFDDLSRSRVLLVGAGETIELVARHLSEQGVTNMVVANRTLARAEGMAAEFGAKAVTLPQIPEHLADADIVISSTASPLPILGKGMVENALKARRHQPMLLVDIAVPRDIESEVADLESAYLYTVDDLQGIVEKNMASRLEAAEQAELIAHDQSSEFMSWLRSLDSVATIRAYRNQSELLKQDALLRAQERLAQGADPEAVMLELANKLTNKLIHSPTQALSKAARSGDLDSLELLRGALGIDDN